MKIMVIDGNSILNRAFYGVRQLSNHEGLPTNAVYGFLATLFKLQDDEKPDRTVVCFDVKEKTFRHLKFDSYKATRKGMPDELAAQLPLIKDVLDAMGIVRCELPGYEAKRAKVIANTKALLAGLPANNVLLYGDAGTGKSSTVKAIANEYAADGLRLVEVKKNQLYQIPAVMESLADNPLKFILFIDDLSFSYNDDDFAALKAILEGSVGGRSHNTAVYATSNRRHLVKERMSDREGDDLHASDTRQELMSLSARFGLTVTFQRPDKARYEAILLELAKQYGVQMPADQLYIKGEAFALRAGGRSPRVAKQFIELCKSGVQV